MMMNNTRKAFEQLTLNGYLSRELVQKKYRMKIVDTESRSFTVLEQGQKGIVPKLDWLTFMCSQKSIAQIFEFLGLIDYVDFEDVLKNEPFKRANSFDDRIVYSFEGISFDFSVFSNDVMCDDFNFFTDEVDVLRVDISGSGLDYLRFEGFDCDTKFRDPDYFNCFFGLGNYHITRADFSFDYVNFNGDMLDKLFNYCHWNQTESGRLSCIGTCAPLRYTERHGSDETLYIGSPTSDRLLRIYDKRLQYIERASGVYIKNNPYSNPDSWIRLELQTRNKKADELLFSKGSYFAILKWIYEKYKFRDLSSKEPIVHQVWKDIFYADEDFATVEKLTFEPNNHFVQFVTPEEKVINQSVRMSSYLIKLQTVLLSRGSNLNEYVNELLKLQQVSINDDLLDLKRIKRYRSLLACLDSFNDFKNLKPLIFNIDNGILQFRVK